MEHAAQTLTLGDGDAVLDLATRQLSVAGQPAKLGSRAFDLLAALVAQRDRVVPKHELMERVWPGLVVEENNVQVHVMTLRRILGAGAIATVSGRGYRFTLPVALHDAAGAPRPATPLHGGAAAQRLIGRDALLAQGLAMLAQPATRLLTLSGPGGAGKTRLALRLAADSAPRHADGVYAVMLAPVPSARHMLSAVAAALGVQEGGAVAVDELVLRRLQPLAVLLLLDNLEHLPEAPAQVERLLQACPRLQILATRRGSLQLAREQVLAVPPLALPVQDDEAAWRASPAVRLFAERAAAQGRDVLGRADDLRAAAQVCRRVDGLPLAIELAAARLRVLTPQALAERLTQALPLLASGRADAPLRQQTLRATIAWSHDLLDAAAQRLFARLAVFSGGWSLAAAEAVSGDEAPLVLDALEALMDQHLVQRVDDLLDDARYTMLETVRQFARERLAGWAEADAVHHRHAQHLATLAEALAPRLTSGQRGPALQQLRAEMNNFRRALGWATGEVADSALALRLCAGLTWLWYFDGLYAEGRDWMKAALDLPRGDAPTAALAAVVSGQARLASFAGSMPEAYEQAGRSAALWRQLGDPRGLGFALLNQGIPALFQGGADHAADVLRAAADAFRVAGDAWGEAVAVAYQGVVYAVLPGREDAALPLLHEGRARCQRVGDEWAASTCSGYLGQLAMRRGDFDDARVELAHILHHATETADRFRLGRTAQFLGELELLDGQPAGALPWLVQSMQMAAEQGRTADLPTQAGFVARALCGLQRFEAACSLLAVGERASEGRPSLPPVDPALPAAARAACLKALGPARFDAAWRAGQGLSLEAAVALARRQGEAGPDVPGRDGHPTLGP